MLKLLVIFLIISSCTRENKKFIIEDLRKTCSTCVTAFEEQQSEDCIEDSKEIYDDLLASTNSSFDNLTIASKWEVVYNSSQENKGEIYLVDKTTNSNGEKYLYFYVRPPSTGIGSNLGDIDNPFGSSRIIRVSKTSNQSVASRLQILSCLISDNGTTKINNKDNKVAFNYVLTTQQKITQPDGSAIEDVYNLRVYQDQPLFMFIFGFDYNKVTYDTDDKPTTPSKNQFTITKVASTTVAILHTTLKSDILAANRCHLDSFLPGNNIPFNFPPSTCGSSNFYTLPTFPNN